MKEEDFYATVKLKTGEEIFCKVLPSEENDEMIVLIFNPVIVTEMSVRGKQMGYKIEPWIKTTDEDLFILKLDDILLISECFDPKTIMMYQTFVKSSNRKYDDKPKLTRKMGYISTVDIAKDMLERIYNDF
jgi:hypothetical protein